MDTVFDPLSRSFSQNPYPTYRALRESSRLQYYAPNDMWLVARFSDVSSIVTDPTMIRSLDKVLPAEEIEKRKRADNWHDMPFHSRFVQFSLLDSDGPVHDRLRRLVFQLFTPASIAALRDSVQKLVDEQIDRILGTRQLDFVEDFAASIPGAVIGMVIGMPKDDCSRLRRWSEDIVQYFDIDRNDEKKHLAETTTRAFYEYLNDLASFRRKQPRQDLLSLLVQLYDSGELTEDEFISTCILIVMAGHGSTLDVLGCGMYALLTHADQMQLLRTNPGLIQTAVQEMFRYESPLPFFHRYSTTDTKFGDQFFPAGTRFGLLYGCANRDESAFENADIFDISRNPNRHLAFGGGAHFCLGNHLARQTMDIVFTTLLKRFSSITLAQQRPQYKPGLSVRGLKQLYIELTCA